jgi:hypothetical protein
MTVAVIPYWTTKRAGRAGNNTARHERGDAGRTQKRSLKHGGYTPVPLQICPHFYPALKAGRNTKPEFSSIFSVKKRLVAF